MALIIPNKFAARSGSIQLQEIDDNFQTVATAVDSSLTSIQTVTSSVAAIQLQVTQVQAAVTAVANTPAPPPEVPTGVIVMWSGAIASIPSGWFLCNGTNGTPDLRNRFIVGAGSTYAVAATGGSTDATLPSHTHTGSTNSAGAHTHLIYVASDSYGVGDQSTSWSDTGGNDEQTRYDKTAGATNEAGSHSHSFTTNSTGSSATNANLPPYYSLAYIMKG